MERSADGSVSTRSRRKRRALPTMARAQTRVVINLVTRADNAELLRGSHITGVRQVVDLHKFAGGGSASNRRSLVLKTLSRLGLVPRHGLAANGRLNRRCRRTMTQLVTRRTFVTLWKRPVVNQWLDTVRSWRTPCRLVRQPRRCQCSFSFSRSLFRHAHAHCRAPNSRFPG